MMYAVLSNAAHPEYGAVTIPFPIPREDFDHCMELVEALEIGKVSARDCRVDEISGGWPILGRLEGTNIDLDELDYLAKRLDSFDDGEAARTTLERMEHFRGPSVLSAATRLLHHMSRIFQEQSSSGPIASIRFTDSKLRQRIRDKKIAMGHRPDDHEDQEIRMS